jgi:phage terminase small subunit
MITNKKHLLFADKYKLTNGLTEDAIRCYQIAYPKSKTESARVESSKILQKPTIKKYIQDYKEKIRIERDNSVIDVIKKESNTNILQREKAIEMVSNVAKLMYNQLVKSEEKKPSDIMAFNSTVERLAKMDGWDKSTKQDITILKGVEDLFIED